MKLLFGFPVVMGVLRSPDDGAGAGGPGGFSEPTGDSGAEHVESTTTDPEAGQAPPAGEDEDDDDVVVGPQYDNDPVVSRLRKKVQKLNRADRASREFKAQLAAHGITDPKEVATYVARARQFDDLEKTFQSHPELRKYTQPHTPEPEPQEQEEQYDPSTFPFDPNAPGADWMLAQHKDLWETKQQLRRLLSEQSRRTLAEQKRETSQVVGTWKSKTDDAANRIPEKFQGLPVRQMFRDAVYGAFRELRAQGKQPTAAHIDRIVAHYTAEFKPETTPARTPVDPKVAAQTRMANANQNLPRGGHGGVPAPPQRRKENVFELGRRLRTQAR